ncbi:hypothetical protein HPP92_022316 [Vanilla planifolia]|uniref:Uncharacterized protein n=1 Tax=Vanilla planifolia TaxID=51239 RepID=A0A835UFB0_VANPL|nr:hypothetical protein HPP92_022316 [Vanilla planifolia]
MILKDQNYVFIHIQRFKKFILKQSHKHLSPFGNAILAKKLYLQKEAYNETNYSPQANCQMLLPHRWSKIAMHLPGRTDNEIKNYWNSYLKKRIPSHDQTDQKANPKPKPEQIQPQTRNETAISDSMKALESPSFPRILFAEWLTRDLHGCPKAPGLENQWELNSKWKDSWPGEMPEESFAGGFEEGGMFEGLPPMNQGLGFVDLFAVSQVGVEGYMGCDVMMY